jgi:general stress protein 26
MDLQEVKDEAKRLSPWAHLATVGADGEPDVVPIHPCWEGDVLWAMVGLDSEKVRNVSANPKVALHWQVSEQGDGVELWGRAAVWDDIDTKRRLWDGVFDYDLDLFSPGGPGDSPGVGFLAITPSRVVVIRRYGSGGIERWSAG